MDRLRDSTADSTAILVIGRGCGCSVVLARSRLTCQPRKVTFEVNGYYLSDLIKDPVQVESSVAKLIEVVVKAGVHMARLGEQSLAERLSDLAERLRVSGHSIDDDLERAYIEVTALAGDACVQAAGPAGMRLPNDRNAKVYKARGWSLVDLFTVRVGGVGRIVHPSGRQSQDQ